MLAATGPFSIPSVTTKAVYLISHEHATFDDVVMGEEATVTLTIKNDGVCPQVYYFIQTLELLVSRNRRCYNRVARQGASHDGLLSRPLADADAYFARRRH